MSIINFVNLKKNLSKDYSKFKKIRIAVLGDSATQLLVQAIKGYGYNEKIYFEVFEANYQQIERQVLDIGSELYNFNPECIIIFESTEKLMNDFYKLDKVQKNNFSNIKIERIKNFWDNIDKRLNCKIINFNFVEIDDNVFGNFASKVNVSFLYQIRKLNFNLMNVLQDYKNVFINDVCTLQNIHGRKNVFDTRLYISSKMVFSLDILPLVVKNIIDIIRVANGKIKKCLIFDLDNTLWGGIIGDDGMNGIQIGELGVGQAFSELQMWAKQLKERGIILAICSKNTENIAKEPFINHPDMILRLDDITLFLANWENKIDNIRHIQSTLNIGFDSMVFIDDDPFERNMVREILSEICVPELPKDPVDYLSYLRDLNLFETASYSEEDAKRTQKYQIEVKRKKLKSEFSSIDDYLKSLEMVVEVGKFNDYYVPRIAQLTQRSNQFNLRTKRYTEQDIDRIRSSKKYINRYFKLKDKFGKYGLVSVLILKKLDKDSIFIDTLITSCRVLKRGMEEFIFNKLAEIASKESYSKIIGEYIPTPKNALVKDLYKNYGFKKEGTKWVLDIKNYKKKRTFIRKN